MHTSRAGQPKELYGSGQKKVAPHYDAIRDYVRNGADRVDTQAAIFRTVGTSKERMQELMQHAGYTAPEMQQVLQQAA